MKTPLRAQGSLLNGFAVVVPGLEAVCARELEPLAGVSAILPLAGGVEFAADRTGLARANLWLRTASRVLVRLGSVVAKDFAKLRRRAAELPWEQLFDAPGPIEWAITARRSRLYHTGAIAERLEGAIADRLGASAQSDRPLQRFVVRAEDDQFTISADSSGELLHRRGWRTEAGEAPLRETLAAGVLALAQYDPSLPLFDPTCGSGTFAIEAALIATDRAPGLGRGFAFQQWSGYVAHDFALLVAEAQARIRAAPAPIAGSDIDPALIELATRNAARAGVAEAVRFSVGPVGQTRPPAGGRGLVVANPPYGQRLGATAELYRALGRVAPEWGLAVLGTDRRLLAALGRTRRQVPLVNGGLPILLTLR